MPITRVDSERVRGMLAEGVRLVEVLPRPEYEEQHLPGAINIPLKELDADAVGHLEREKAVIVYCWDSIWDLSPRAACRLETLGFREIYDYVAGKVDWLARGLPSEGEKADRPKAVDIVRTDVVTSALDDRVGTVRERVEESPYGFALVVSKGGVLLGRLRRSLLRECDPQLRAEDVMESGPSTVRPDSELSSLVEQLRKKELAFAIVTGPDGKLIGVVRCRDAESVSRPT